MFLDLLQDCLLDGQEHLQTMTIGVNLLQTCHLAERVFPHFVVEFLSSSLDVGNVNGSEDTIVALVFFVERFGVASTFFSGVFKQLLLNFFLNTQICLFFEF